MTLTNTAVDFCDISCRPGVWYDGDTHLVQRLLPEMAGYKPSTPLVLLLTLGIVLLLSFVVFMSVYLARKQQDALLWQPPSGSRDEWFACRGLPCEEWQEVETRMTRLQTLFLQQILPNGNSVDTSPWSRDADDSPPDDGIVYNLQQIDDAIALLEGATHNNTVSKKRKRRLIRIKTYQDKWKNPLVYKFDGTHDDEQRANIRAGLDLWQEKTCLRFDEVKATVNVADAHILFTKHYKTCWTYVGKATRIQPVNLGDGCFRNNKMGIVLHEIGHVLGLYHEQQRADRADNVRILYDQIRNYGSQFVRMPTHDYGLHYDYGSVMHYKWNAASRSNQEPTMVALREPYDRFTTAMGQRSEISYTDAKRINLEYCKESCRYILPRACERGGYQDPRVCTQCICPDGFGGKWCETVAPSNDDRCLGRTIRLSAALTIATPGYGAEGYSDFTECYWQILAPPGERVTLTFDGEFAVYQHELEVCYHWMEVKYEYNMEQIGPRFCGYRQPGDVIISRTNEMVVIFRSHFPTVWPNVRRGFKVIVNVTVGSKTG